MLPALRPDDLPRVCLATRPDPEDIPRRIGPIYPQLPFVVLVVADATARPDPRPIEDRRPLRLTRDRFDKVMAEQKLAVEVAVPGASPVELRFRSLADFSPEAVERRLAPEAPLPAARAMALLRAVFADPRVTALERAWRGLRMLVDEAGEHAEVELLNASAEDLDFDFDDWPTLAKSGLSKVVNGYNHLGMRPFGALVLADDLGARARRLQDVAEIARGAHAAVIAAAHALEPFPGYPAWRQSEAARCVARVRERCVVAPAHAYRGPVEVSGALAVAALLLQAHARTQSPWRFLEQDASLPRVELVPAPDEVPGLLALGPDTRVACDDVCRPGEDRSLAVLLFGNRLIHELLNTQWRRGLGRGMGAAEVAAGLRRGLSTRLGGVEIEVEVEARGASPAIEIDLTLRFSAWGEARSLRRSFVLPDDW